MKCKGIYYKKSNKVNKNEFYVKLEMTKATNHPCVVAVYADGTHVDRGEIVVISENILIKPISLNPNLGFRLDKDTSIIAR